MAKQRWLEIFTNDPRQEGEAIRAYSRRIAPKYSTTPANIANKYNENVTRKGLSRDLVQYNTEDIKTDKVEMGEFDWRDAIRPLKEFQNIFKAHKGSQDFASWEIKTKKPICVLVLGDTHMGSWATDYDKLIAITDEIINTPNLYVILVGDLLQMSIKLRGVLEVSDNALPPYWQIRFLESWLMSVKHKVICSTWDNHSVMREENAVGYSTYAEIFKRHTIYHSGIGHVDIKVGKEVYKVAVAHFFRGRTMLNPVHGQMRYMRFEANDREICAAGDSHVAGLIKYKEGGTTRIALNSGSLQNSGYGKRLFSLKHQDHFPCFSLDPNRHEITPYWSVSEWLKK
jgi:hypothetical protein